MTILLKSEKVLPLQELEDDVALFGDDEEGESTTALAVHRSQWEDLGRPAFITVSVRPGDHLNNED